MKITETVSWTKYRIGGAEIMQDVFYLTLYRLKVQELDVDSDYVIVEYDFEVSQLRTIDELPFTHTR